MDQEQPVEPQRLPRLRLPLKTRRLQPLHFRLPRNPSVAKLTVITTTAPVPQTAPPLALLHLQQQTQPKKPPRTRMNITTKHPLSLLRPSPSAAKPTATTTIVLALPRLPKLLHLLQPAGPSAAPMRRQLVQTAHRPYHLRVLLAVLMAFQRWQ